VPLLVAQEVLQLPAHQIIVFHRDLPPALLDRANWLEHPALQARHGLSVPPVAELPWAPRLPGLEDSATAAPPTVVAPAAPRGRRARDQEQDARQQHLDFGHVREAW
jgi:type IV secretory pathway TraG/TraD family ATPase VirD4